VVERGEVGAVVAPLRADDGEQAAARRREQPLPGARTPVSVRRVEQAVRQEDGDPAPRRAVRRDGESGLVEDPQHLAQRVGDLRLRDRGRGPERQGGAAVE
jgi:hypothetical protein